MGTFFTTLFEAKKFYPVVAFDDKRDKLLSIDFTENNTQLTTEILNDVPLFCNYIETKLNKSGATFGIGGYGENRIIYSRSRVFDNPDGGEPRRLHLGVDIWSPTGTVVFAPMDGKVHSFSFNKALGDYGATIILEHELDQFIFYSLYGHLSLADLNLKTGSEISGGQPFAHFGPPEENGRWPPHLHFQVIFDLEGYLGDYPGVCRMSEKDKYLNNCPDPDLILKMNQFLQ